MENNLKSVLEKTIPGGVYLGIDPGESGAIVWLEADRIPKTTPLRGCEGYKAVQGYCLRMDSPTVFMERERVSPLMSPGAATTFMTNYGFGLGVLYCSGIEPVLYDPQVWQRMLGLESLLANPDGSKPSKAQKKKHYNKQIRALWGDYVKDVPDYAIDAYGILLAGLSTIK